MKLKLLLALVAATLLLTACPRTPAPPAPGDAEVRALHGVADAPSVDVLVDGEVVLEEVVYKEGSGYLSVTEGEREVQVTVAGDAEAVVLEEVLELAANARYTLIVLGEAAEESEFPIEALVLEDTTEAPEEGNIKVRVVHGVPGAPNVDVYVTGPAGELADPVLEDVPYKGFNEAYLEVPGGDYRIRLTAAGDESVLYDSATVTLAANAVYTLVALPETEPEALSPVTLVVLSSGELPPVGELPDQTPPPAPGVGLSLTATVGTEAGVCAEQSEITVDEGTEVFYCYTITNTGEVTIPLHNLADEVSGVILRDFAFELEPGASVNTVQAGLTLGAVLEETTVNRAVWDGFIGNRRVASAEASTTVNVTPLPEPEVGLSLSATVGTEAGVCAEQSEITVGESTEVFYCYTITNTGEVTIPLHNLADEVSGVILRDFAFELEPGASVNTVEAELTISAVLEETTVNRAVWDGFIGNRRVASAEASTTVTVVGEDDEPPFEYAAVAGTFVGGSNLPTVGSFDGNLLLIGIRNFDGTPIEQQVVVNITVPGIGAFAYTFDPNEAEEGVIGLIIRDFESGLGPMAMSSADATRALSQHLGVPIDIVTLEPQLSVQAAVGGEFVFAFPGQTLNRTVDAGAKLTVPAVTEVTLDEARETLTVTFESAGENVSYQVSAFGRGMNAHRGSTEVDASPATVTLSGALEEEEPYVVDLLAVRGGGNLFAETVSQFDVGAYLYYSEHAE
jgi:hypothetical protein